MLSQSISQKRLNTKNKLKINLNIDIRKIEQLLNLTINTNTIKNMLD